MPRPDAAPPVVVALQPAWRKAPGQLLWVTDDVLPDLHAALGVREGYKWEQRGSTRSRPAPMPALALPAAREWRWRALPGCLVEGFVQRVLCSTRC